MTVRTLLTVSFLVSLLAVLSCAAPPIQSAKPTLRYTLPNGRPTLSSEYPEVGLLRAENYRCTVFTIADDTAVSAAHCVPKTDKVVHLDFSFGSYDVTEWAVLGNTDVAVFHIASIAPRKTIPHMDLATDFSAVLGPLTFVGFGCSPVTLYPTSAPIVLPRGTKRTVDFYPGDVQFWISPKSGNVPRPYFKDSDFRLCGGDSGGPIFAYGTKQVIGVASASLETSDGKSVFYSGSIFEETISFARKIKGIPEEK